MMLAMQATSGQSADAPEKEHSVHKTLLSDMPLRSELGSDCVLRNPEPNLSVRPCKMSIWARRVIEQYPKEAIKAHMQGRVSLRVEVDEAGKVTKCKIVKSSGYAVLNRAACRDVRKYGQFFPATDANAQPTKGSWQTTIVYSL